MKSHLSCLTLLSLVAAALATGKHDLHKLMTDTELHQSLNAKKINGEPVYDVVALSWPTVHEEAHGTHTRLRFNAFGRNIKLWLNPVDGILAGKDTAVYSAKSTMGPAPAVKIAPVDGVMSQVGELFEDLEKQATLLVERTLEGSFLISGQVISEGLIVKPVPERLRHHVKTKYRRSTSEHGNFTIAGDYEPEYHFIYPAAEVPDEVDYITKPIQDDILKNIARRSKRNAPDTIYPQIMILVDYATFVHFNKNIHLLLSYLLPFWNSVDLRYRALENPKVRLNIAAVVIATDPTAFSFITKNKVGPDTLNIYSALISLSLWLPAVKSYFPVDSYDVVVAMAPYSMCIVSQSGLCQPGVLGLAFVSGACANKDSPVPSIQSASVIQDKGGFDGMHTAAHELGHLFGARHDEQKGPVCSAEMGYIMSATPVASSNSADWSSCSAGYFDRFFNSTNPECMFNKPTIQLPIPRILPGRMMSADEQCAHIEGTRSCFKQQNICIGLRCAAKNKDGWCRDSGHAAADGTTCGKNKICIHRKCVAVTDIA